MRNNTFIVDGMGGEDCEMLVEKTLKSLAGVRSAEADYLQGIVDVTYDEQAVTPAEMQEALD